MVSYRPQEHLHFSTMYCLCPCNLTGHGHFRTKKSSEKLDMKERIVAVEDRGQMKEDYREHTTIGKSCVGDLGFVSQYDIRKQVECTRS